jgi:NAD-dependent dihydropyrimidine dehydrogenase PreA subunit
MPKVAIDTNGCRACSLCIDICPTDVFVMNEQTEIAEVSKEDDCIGCTSCQYLCPSRCLTVTEHSAQRPFFRIEQNRQLVEKFLQQPTAAQQLTDADWQEALRDVSVRLHALGQSVTETMGRGQKAVGRKAGQLAAAHLPEMYEGRSVEDVLQRMRKRFESSFDFEPSVTDGGSEITCKFSKCALGAMVEQSGEKVGDALLCGLFHEYWAGLLGAFTNNSYKIEMKETGSQCTMHLISRR